MNCVKHPVLNNLCGTKMANPFHVQQSHISSDCSQVMNSGEILQEMKHNKRLSVGNKRIHLTFYERQIQPLIPRYDIE